MKNSILSVIFISCLLLGTAHGAPPDVERKVDDLMKNWKSVKPEFLRDPANADVVNAVRKRAERVGYRDVRALLLKLDDPGFTSFRLSEFKKSEPLSDGADMVKSGNPKLILVLADALFQEESAQIGKFPDGDHPRYVTPLSVRAAFVIRGIVLENPAFDSSVKTWARSLREVGSRHAERTRAEVRAWFTANRRLLEAGNYRAVKAP
jgi:hypothetical protein